jgi:hypothetical protein
MCDEHDSINEAFKGYLRTHQDDDLFDEAAKKSKYLIGVLPLLTEEYVTTNEFFQANA